MVCRKYRGKISLTKRSLSLTANESPLGRKDTTEFSSFRSISISFRGKGFECPCCCDDDDEVFAGDDDTDTAAGPDDAGDDET